MYSHKNRNAGKSFSSQKNLYIYLFFAIGDSYTYPVEMIEAKCHSCHDDSHGTVVSPSVTWTCRDTHTNTTSSSISQTLGKAVVNLLVCHI